MKTKLSVLVTPHAGLHYLELLYRDFDSSGVRVKYSKGPTPSQTLNVLVSPVMLMWNRIWGFRILHIHWLFQFSLPWARRRQWARRFMEWWFGVFLRSAEFAGYSIIWTAHDLLPHEQIFANDVRARDLLLTKTSAIIALSEATASELRALGGRSIHVIPIGPYSDPYEVSVTREQARASFGFGDGDVVMVLIGRIEEYKGADLLLLATARLPETSRIRVLLAGVCPDHSYRRELERLAADIGGRAVLSLEFVPDQDIARHFQAADFAVFPFREITNSASVLLAQSFGLPIIISDLPALADLPNASAIRVRQDVQSLRLALQDAEQLSVSEYREMSAAGFAWAHRLSWAEVTRETIETYEEACLTRGSR